LRTALSGGRHASRSLGGSGAVVFWSGFIAGARVRPRGNWDINCVRVLAWAVSPVAEASRWSSVYTLSVGHGKATDIYHTS
jgi:hypothetical protein